jgi:hypothetical protein
LTGRAPPGPAADFWVKPAQGWKLRASPLRPAPQDIQFAVAAVRQWSALAPSRPVRALLLGVTPEIAAMQWPAGTQLVAVDRSLAMIHGVWPGAAAHANANAVCADWVALPVPDGSHDVIVGDGCFNAMTWPAYAAMVRAMRQVLHVHGVVSMRVFVQPDRPEPKEAVFDDLFKGRIGNAHVFKWRLSMALHRSLTEGVCHADIWNAWHAAVPRPEQLAQDLKWPLPEILSMDDFRQASARYSFPTLDEFRSVMAGSFEETGCFFPAYELGERCPTLTFRPR